MDGPPLPFPWAVLTADEKAEYCGQREKKGKGQTLRRGEEELPEEDTPSGIRNPALMAGRAASPHRLPSDG